MITDEQRAARTARAVAAAVSAGRDLGITVTEPEVLYDVFSVIVRLAPSPVVVRVPTVLPRTTTLETQLTDQRRELAVASWLGEKGLPVVKPSPLVPAEPVQRDGFSMTFWELVEFVEDANLTVEYSAKLVAKLHAALRDYPGELAVLNGVDPFIPDGLTRLEGRPDLLAPADLDRARREWAVFRPLLASEEAFAEAFPGATVQPIHGDAPGYNLIVTTDGELYSDFELVNRGPIERDLAFNGPEGIEAYNAAAGELGLREVDERVLRTFEAVGLLQVVACLSMAPELPMLVDGMKPMIDQWRGTPFAGGLA
ncbi:aminoglycoside phosphotransferase family protein [Amycolatopsis regifaucium]|uniref:Aminoglycoside phosphotransferase n=1 Tax=Amycolatopsis regifaucium TaxID=546365 RepID=A0A154M628_9PSEU|nr:aminoglycoside phosphotransferase family protein [Amycolatopsis regifaucium]KZB79890.1 aminoglycoside phosphotransferase [Amycolatopsis regifaucium]OKA09792.1 aminoglycoside phosphotransferase [Amycolatopsis regifaucium]SFJ35535.1 Phosphotransferase enzyme family protein [Amycolatopsis regifaucium]